MSVKRGALIIFEGLDGIGKTTQSKLLYTYLSNECQLLCEHLTFPNRSTPTGSLIDSYLQHKINLNDHTIHLLFSANRWECINSMRTKLLQGYTLIVDRYAYSGVAYSQAKGLDRKWCQSCDIGLLQPDLVLYFDCKKQFDCLTYIGNERYETRQFQEKVEDCFQQFHPSNQWKTIDVIDFNCRKMRDRESIQNEIRLYVEDCFKKIKNNNIEELWKDN